MVKRKILNRMLIAAKVIANSKKAGVAKTAKGRLVISVCAAALGGRANREALELLSKHLRLKPGKIRLVSGGHKPAKIFEVTN